ncbi:MAG: hypothetical protein IKO02_08780, partial [Lentisphaeria bacterium]|nr:hypothetical protein [Lentisphaeria bacterium]
PSEGRSLDGTFHLNLAHFLRQPYALFRHLAHSHPSDVKSAAVFHLFPFHSKDLKGSFQNSTRFFLIVLVCLFEAAFIAFPPEFRSFF